MRSGVGGGGVEGKDEALLGSTEKERISANREDHIHSPSHH